MEEINKLIKSDEIINDRMKMSLLLLEANNLTLSNELLKYVNSKKIVLVNDSDLKYSHVRYALSGGKCYVNVYGYAKEKKDTDELIIQVNELYCFLLQAYCKINFSTLTYNREALNHCVTVYADLMKKAVLKSFHLTATTARNKLDYILMYFILCNTPKKIVTNVEGYCKKLSNITEEDLKMLQVKYSEFQKEQSISTDRLWEILQGDFIFLKNVKFESLKYNAIYFYGAKNAEIIDDLSVVATIILDYVFHNKATLNIEKNNFIKDAIKPKMYNELIHAFLDKL